VLRDIDGLKQFADRHRLPINHSTLVGGCGFIGVISTRLNAPDPELDAELAAVGAELDNLDIDAVFREIEEMLQ
jgi:hypothetical protein